jgi:hypothetical protein
MSTSEQLIQALERADWVALILATAGAVTSIGAVFLGRNWLAQRGRWRLLLNVVTGAAAIAAVAAYFAIFDSTSSFLSANALLAFGKQHGFPTQTREQVLNARARDRMVIESFEEVTLFVVPHTIAYPTWVAFLMGPASVGAGIMIGAVLSRRSLRA